MASKLNFSLGFSTLCGFHAQHELVANFTNTCAVYHSVAICQGSFKFLQRYALISKHIDLTAELNVSDEDGLYEPLGVSYTDSGDKGAESTEVRQFLCLPEEEKQGHGFI